MDVVIISCGWCRLIHIDCGYALMISLVFGNLGSGKTATMVRAMSQIRDPIYTNIVTPLPHVQTITQDMLMKRNVVRIKKNGDEDVRIVFNEEYWVDQVKQHPHLHIVLDEFHLMMDARRSTSTPNKIMADFLAMGRRLVGHSAESRGSLTFITQLSRRADVIAKEMATRIQWTRSHKLRRCETCNWEMWQSNDEPVQMWRCPVCERETTTAKVNIELWLFDHINKFYDWYDAGKTSYYNHVMIYDIEQYFNLYNTKQWEDMFKGMY